MPPPPVHHQLLIRPRAGRGADDTEDAAAVQAEAWPGRAAIADGATESIYAGVWARALVQRLVARTSASADAFAESVAQARAQWRSVVAKRAGDRPWYVRAKAEEGAFAAALGLYLGESGRWRAVAVGDSCLFHLRAGRTQQAWPFSSPGAFTNRPSLLPSRRDRPVPEPRRTTGRWQPGDAFLLATDAVAAWLLHRGPETFLGADDEAFRTAVTEARREGTLRNDDATLLVLGIETSPAS